MPEQVEDFREKLLGTQEMTPTLREGYQRELDAILQEKPTLRGRLAAGTLMVICVAVVIAEVRAMIVHRGSPSFYIAGATMLAACATVAYWIARDLMRGKVPRKHVFQVSELFFGVSWLLVVVQLMKGLSAKGDPASTYDVLFLMSFAAVCTAWSLANRITAAELSAKEQALRLECRLADLAGRLGQVETQPGDKRTTP
jgi:hypothetical protein